MKRSLREIYDSFARTYDQNRGLFDMGEVLSQFYNFLEIKQGELLDLGCGAGEPFARFFVDFGWKGTGGDFSVKMFTV